METMTLPVEDVEWIPVEESTAPGRVRRATVALARRLRFSEYRMGEVAIAATELSTNVQKHAAEGVVALRVRRTNDVAAVEIMAIDSGPGIADVASVTQDGDSTVGSLGVGLGAVMRLATWFDVYSLPGCGTVMVATFWPADAPVERSTVAALTRTMGGQLVCGDAYGERSFAGVTTLLLVDGLGHGG